MGRCSESLKQKARCRWGRLAMPRLRPPFPTEVQVRPACPGSLGGGADAIRPGGFTQANG